MKNLRLPQLLLGLAAVAIIATAIVYTAQRFGKQPAPVTNTNTTANVNEVACTADAKQCPDGSYVSRVPPSCEFAECPETNVNNNAAANVNATADAKKDWKTYTNVNVGYSILYPPKWSVEEAEIVKIVSDEVWAVQSPAPGSPRYLIFIRTISDAKSEIDKLQDRKTVTVNGIAADQGLIVGIPHERVTVLQRGATVVRISWSGRTDEIGTEIEHQILSTFQFTDQTAATHPAQEQEWTGGGDSVIYWTSAGSAARHYQTVAVEKKATAELLPPGYLPIDVHNNYRLIFMQKDGDVYVYDRQTKASWKTVLPTFVPDGEQYQAVRVVAYSTDGVEAIIEYAFFDKKSPDYSNDFAGPNPSSRKAYRYNVVADAIQDGSRYIATGGGFFGTYLDLWNRQTNTTYQHLSGEGIGSVTPITAKNVETGAVSQSPDYGNNSGPWYSDDGTIIGVPEQKDSLKIHLFRSGDVTAPYKTLTLPEVVTKGAQGLYIYSLHFSHDNQKIAIALQDRLYVVDINTGKTTLIFDDPSSGLGWDANVVAFSPTDRYIFFADYEKSNSGAKTGTTSSVKAVQLSDNAIILLKTSKESVGLPF